MAVTDGEAVDDGTLVDILLHEIRSKTQRTRPPACPFYWGTVCCLCGMKWWLEMCVHVFFAYVVLVFVQESFGR